YLGFVGQIYLTYNFWLSNSRNFFHFLSNLYHFLFFLFYCLFFLILCFLDFLVFYFSCFFFLDRFFFTKILNHIIYQIIRHFSIRMKLNDGILFLFQETYNLLCRSVYLSC